jgi:hypothetical protein
MRKIKMAVEVWVNDDGTYTDQEVRDQVSACLGMIQHTLSDWNVALVSDQTAEMEHVRQHGR